MLEINRAVKEDISLKEVKIIPELKEYVAKDAKESKAFWDDLFKANEPTKEISIEDENIFAKIFGRNEDEFVFDFDIEARDVQNILSEFSPEIWDTLSDKEKTDRIFSMIEVLAEKLGISSTPKLILFEADIDNCGAFNPKDNVIKINKALFEDPKELINTIAHEMRHAFQSMRAELGETLMDVLYALNFDNYISPTPVGEGKFIFFVDYEEQLVEAEARAFANMFC